MTINNTTRTAGPFIGNGVTTAFPFSYKVFSREDLLVAQTVIATSVETILVLDSDYTVTLNLDQNTAPGGIITMIVAPPTGTSLAATSDVDMNQTLDLTNNGGFYPAVINIALDRIVVMIQQLAARVGAGALNIGAAAKIDTILNTLITLATAAGSTLIGFLQAGAGAVLMTLQAALRERVSPMQFGAVGSGAVDDWAACQAAITYCCTGNVKTLVWPDGIFKVSQPLVIPATGSGLVMKGASSQGTYIYSTSGAFDLLRVAASYCTIKKFLFRPGGNQLCMRVYAAHCTIQNNRFLAAVNNVGTAALLTDVDPDTAAIVAGAYTHNIDNNVVGVGGYAFAIGLDLSSTNGMQACKITKNQILSDRCIVMPKGGANLYTGNLLQSSTGTAGTPAGTGIDIGVDAVAEKVYGNYHERFAQGILLRPLVNTNQIVHSVGNHFDNCTAQLTSLGTINYIHEAVGGSMTTRGWVDNYSSSTIRRWLTPSGGEGFNLSSSGLFQVGTTAGANHTINTIGAAEAAIILTLQGGGNSASFFRHVTGTGANGANTGFSVKANSVTSRSINAGGTINASGADYAEYMRKSRCCFDIVKGQIVGTDVNGELTHDLVGAVHFFVKSTNPSLVGGDDWDDEPQPDAPAEPVEPHAPRPPFKPTEPAKPPYFINDAHEQAFLAEVAAYDADVLAYQDLKIAFDASMVKHVAAVANYQAALLAMPERRAAYHQAMEAWAVQHEAKRARMDRIAFCGQVPVNVWGAKPGDYILPDGGGTAWDLQNDPEVPDWFKKHERAVGKVLKNDADGRAIIIVKGA